MRIATFDTELYAKGPGQMLAAINKRAPQVMNVARRIAANRPDVILVLGIDLDAERHGIHALANLIGAEGHDLPHRIVAGSNRGLASGGDLDDDGRTDGPGDNQGFARFRGQNGMAILSRYPLAGAITDHSGLLWNAMPGDGATVLPQAARAVQRLASNGFWQVPISLPWGDKLTLLTLDASPPVFDGPEDRNGLRNADEVRFWRLVLDGAIAPPPDGPFVILGNANLDPRKGEGRREAIEALLEDPRLTDPLPQNDKGGLDTVNWPSPGPGPMRVDYVLPSRDLLVVASGQDTPDERPKPGERATRHRLVWVDVTWP
ncbi:endonuclease/exonuclease/phosphatase family protein [Shimia biformata]|uniref:endonuclease/exonuclease/phosphatase family protein n=1 Tax=Shimia biformata TaxID=1294299 RepID=UPI00194F6F68|nr:endonuclease/exonuclease/phosphatase family protein [Shimia biformata]